MPWTLANMQADRDAVWNWVVECTPQLQDHMEWQNGWGDEAAWGDEGTDWLNHITYLSHRPFETTSSDTPPSTAFHPVLIEPINFSRSVPFEGDGGLGTATYGSISIALPEELDGLLASYWSGRVLRLLAGGTYNVGKSSETTATWSEYAEVGKYYITDFDYDESALRLYLRDAMHNLGQVLETPESHRFKGPTFKGKNTFLEGGDDLAGRHKPLVIGTCRNVPMYQVNAEYEIYFVSQRVHPSGPGTNPTGLNGVSAVRDQGIARTKFNDMENLGYDDLRNFSITDNQWLADLELGLIRMGGSKSDPQVLPQGTLTCDCTGGYTDNTINKTVRRFLKFNDPGAVMGDSLTDPVTVGTETAGIYIGLEEFNPGQLLNEILNNAGIFLYVNRAGEYEVATHVDLSDSTSYTVAETLEGRKSQVDTPLDIVRINRLATRPPVYSVVVSYDRNWTIQQLDDFDKLISIEDRNDYARESRHTEEALSGQIISSVPTARKIVLEGGYVTNLTDAESIRDDILTRSTLTPNLWEVEIIFPLFTLEVNDVVTIYHDRFGFDAGKDAEIISIVEQHDRAILTVVTAQ